MDIVYKETLYSRPTPVSSIAKTLCSTPTKKKSTKTGKFEIYTDKVGEYRFRLKAPNGEIIAVGEGYTTKESCMNGIHSVQKYVLKSKIVDLKK